MRGATRRQHADSQLLMLQNPHRHWHGAHRRDPRARLGRRWVAEARQLHTRKVPRRNKSRPTRTTPCRFGTKLSQHAPSHRMCGTKLSLHEPHGPTSGTKLSLLARNGSIWRSFYMQGEFCTVLTTKKPSRENFVPNARRRSSEPSQQHTRPHLCGGCRRDRSGGHRRNRRARADFEARGLTTLPAGRDGTWPRQISHVISDGHFLRPPKNVAIPTR